MKATPAEFRKGDKVAIEVGANWGEVSWYTFDSIMREFDEKNLVVGFDVGSKWPLLDFVLNKEKQFEIEREAAVA